MLASPSGRDADRLVAVALAGLAVRLQKPARRLPASAPVGLGELRGFKVVPHAGQPLPAPHHMHDTGLPVGPLALQPVLKHVQAARLGVPLPFAAVAAGCLLRALRADGQGQPVRDGTDPRLQTLDVGELATPGQRPLIVCGLGERTGPPGRRHPRQTPLARRPRLRGMLQPLRTPHPQVPRGERAEVRAHQREDLLIGGRELLQPGPDRHPRGTGHHERRRNLPQPAHPAPLVQPLDNPLITPTSLTRKGHTFGRRTLIPFLRQQHAQPPAATLRAHSHTPERTPAQSNPSSSQPLGTDHLGDALRCRTPRAGRS
jgi:hypothetical protein